MPREQVPAWNPSSKAITVRRSWSSRAGELGALNDLFMPASHQPPPRWVGEETIELDGTWSRMRADEFEQDLLLMRYTFDTGDVRDVRIMVASDLMVRVWLDDAWLFGRDGGHHFPTPHMPRLNTFADVELTAGRHELTVVLHRPEAGTVGDWVVAIADSRTLEWLPDALRPND